jgi:hypothetical protein
MYSTVNSIFHTSIGLTVTGLARAYCMQRKLKGKSTLREMEVGG